MTVDGDAARDISSKLRVCDVKVCRVSPQSIVDGCVMQFGIRHDQ
jgi:hypothetical protein